MVTKQVLRHGDWQSPITIDDVVAKSKTFMSPRVCVSYLLPRIPPLGYNNPRIQRVLQANRTRSATMVAFSTPSLVTMAPRVSSRLSTGAEISRRFCPTSMNVPIPFTITAVPPWTVSLMAV